MAQSSLALLVGIAWVAFALRPFIRTIRFGTVLVAGTAILVATLNLPRDLAFVAQGVTAVIVLTCFIVPERLGLASLSMDELGFDDLVRTIVRAEAGMNLAMARTAVQQARADGRLSHLDTADPRWRQVVTLLDWQSPTEDTQGNLDRSSVVLAARHLWHDVRNRRVLGRHSMSGPWDFDLYLQVQLQRTRGATSPAAKQVIAADTLSAPPPDATWGGIRDLLVEVMSEPDQDALFAPASNAAGGDKRESRLDEAWRKAQARYRDEAKTPAA